MYKSLFILPLIALLTSCIREPEIVTETIIETDTLYVHTVDTVTITVTDTVTLQQYIEDTATTFILVRHGETTGTGSDPLLSAAGMTRADDLKRILSKVPLSAVYSSNYNRTRSTAQPTADAQMLPVVIFDPLNQGPLIDDILMKYRGKTVLIVGHSNTTPVFLNLLTGANTFSTIPDTEYDNLFVANVFEKGRAKVLHMKYGN